MIDLKLLRETHGWTEAQMACYLGVRVGTYRNWEKGRRAVPDTVVRLVEVLALIEALAPEIHKMLEPSP